MRPIYHLLAGLLGLCLASQAMEPSFENQAKPEGWTIVGQVADGDAMRAAAGSLTATTSEAFSTPAEITMRLRADTDGAWMRLQVLAPDGEKPALETMFRLHGATLRGAAAATVSAAADGAPLPTNAISTRTWSVRDKYRGSLRYGWRFPRIRNTWLERDRLDIGHDYEDLTHFDQKTFSYRIVLGETHCQVWLDGRLLAESATGAPDLASLKLVMVPGVTVESIQVAPLAPPQHAGMDVLELSDWFHDRETAASRDLAVPLPDRRELTMPVLTDAQVDLSRSLYRFRLTKGTGPDAPYVNGRVNWPDAFTVDPAVPTFRVPYRPWKAVHLVVWEDDSDPVAVPRGTLRFVRHQTGAPATTAIDLHGPGVERLTATTPSGKSLYRITLPVDSAALYGFRDMAGEFLEFQLTKPVTLTRSYPDPIYYGEHPYGPPSSLRVVGIALEESPFDFAVEPTEFGHVFELPAAATYRVPVTNQTTSPIRVQVRQTATNPETGEVFSAQAELDVPASGSAAAELALPADVPGWHSLETVVTQGDYSRRADLSLVMLPPNTRTYGDAPNETRFGSWNLWGHYAGIEPKGQGDNAGFLNLMRKLGIRRIGMHSAFMSIADAQAADLLPKGPHTTMAVYHRLNVKDPDAMAAMLKTELDMVADTMAAFPRTSTYYYGGEWGPSRETTHGVYPIYTGQDLRPLTEAELTNINRQRVIFTAIGQAMRETYPDLKLHLQWGSPMGTIPFMREGFPKELVDAYGMDQPMFEVLPEHISHGSMHETLWQLRAEAERLGWPRLPIGWVEGPFLPTRPGALTEAEQANHIVRYLMLGMTYGIDQFEAAVVPFEAGNYYGSEHYGAGVFHRPPLYHPKPAVAAIATTTQMLCGADLIGPVATGNLSTYCLAFAGADGEPLYALWRVRGESDATIAVANRRGVTLTHASGRSEDLRVRRGQVSLRLSDSPVWLTGAGEISAISLDAPVYADAPLPHSRVIALTDADWTWSTDDVPSYTSAHVGIPRKAEPVMTATFGQALPDIYTKGGHMPAVSIALPVQPDDAPLLLRYGALKPAEPIELPGEPSYLGLWVDGNSGFGRIAYQLRDAEGELWRSTGTVDDWNCDDPHGWSLIAFEDLRYLRFPLPGNHPWDRARKLESTWWHSEGGDGIVDYPVSVEAVYVEARNELPYFNVMTLIPDRDIAVGNLTAEYDSAAAMSPSYLNRYVVDRPTPSWQGPQSNIIAELRENGVGQCPAITEFHPPHHFPDGRRMVIRFNQEEGYSYRLYLSLYEDGRGAELITHPNRPLDDNSIVHGLIPGTPLYLFMTRVDAEKRESKPSPVYKLVTQDNFSQK